MIGYVILLSGLSLCALAFFLINRVYLIGSDTFYYMSIADSVLQNGTLSDLTSVPAQALKTTQNGVVFFHVVLSRLGMGPEGRLISIVVINYLLHLSAVYPLYKTARRIGLEGSIPIMALLAVHLGAFHVYRMQLIPINDGVFNALSLWLAYFVVIALQDFPSPTTSDTSGKAANWPLRLAVMLALSAILVHFRLNLLLVLGAAVLAALVVRRYRHVVWGTALLAVSVASLALPYYLSDSSRIVSQGDRIFNDIPARLPAQLFDLVTVHVPGLLFSPVGDRECLIYVPFALSLLLALAHGFLKREPGALFISLSCTAAFLFLGFLPFGTHRYLIYIFPFMYLLILLPNKIRPIAYMFVALVLASSLVTFVDGFHRAPVSEFWLYLHDQRISLPSDDPLLVSQQSRHPYFFLGVRPFRDDLTWDRISVGDGTFLLGDAEFTSARLTEIERMAEQASFTFTSSNLTPGYQDEEGHAIVQLYDFKSSVQRQQ